MHNDQTSPREPQQQPGKSKKWLLITGLVVLIAVVSAAWFAVIVLLRPSASNSPGSGSNTSPSTTGTSNASCNITASAPEGPYYVTGTAALVASDLNYAKLPGEQIIISGHVYGGAGTDKPIPNAIIDLWQTDSDGKYHPQGNGPANRYSAEQLALRGYVLTDTTGAYSFASIYPGEYEDRARHIHARVTADGYSGVTTQLIVPKDDDKTAATDDTIAKSLPRCNTLTFTDGAATFDFHLE